MGVEERLEALEKRLQAAEDELAIVRLLNSYGPMIDSGESESAAHLWIEGGTYDVGGYHTLVSPDQMVTVWSSADMQAMINAGSAHLTASPQVKVKGDTAEALAYAFVMLKEGDRWYLWRASVNHWTFVRTTEGWRIKERYNRALDGSDESHAALRRMLP